MTRSAKSSLRCVVMVFYGHQRRETPTMGFEPDLPSVGSKGGNSLHMRMHAEDARRNGWTGRDGLREGGQRGKGEGGRVGGAGREVRVAREIRREGGRGGWDSRRSPHL